MLDVLKQLLENTQSAGFRSMASRGLLVCPSCGSKPGDLPAGPVEVIACPSCGTRASAAEWTGTPLAGTAADPDPVALPAGSRIIRSGDGSGEVVWHIPASGNSGGLLFFAIFWCAITAIVSGAFLVAFLTGGEIKGEMPEWVLIPFFGIFWAVGLGMFYAGFRSKYARHRITAGPYRVVLLRELFGRSTEKCLAAAGITSVSREVFYQKNYRAVFGVEIKGAGGKLRFGSTLTDDEKTWLVADMKRVMMKERQGPSFTAPTSAPRVRQAYFSVALPKSRSSLMPMAMVLVGMGAVFAVAGTFINGSALKPSESDDRGLARTIEQVFHLATQGFLGIWMLISGIIALVGIVMLVVHLKSQGKETRLEATDSEISIRTFKYGRILQDRTFPRSAVTDIRCSGSGSSNGKPMKRIELIVGEKADKIAWWIDGDLADAFVSEVRGALG
ncbi:MAG: hypothetical protein EOP88_19050 [Verrucomicrobiaceae bacterium]|nr:MAG: hypothetical protein EOP88_19050 [Verrucomicrobiaceae bacterium]